MTDKQSNHGKIDTILTHSGRKPEENWGIVNPPVYHASTILFPNTKELIEPTQKYRYGRRGTPTVDAMLAVLDDMEGAHQSFVAASGLAAIALAYMSCVKAGDHVLVADNVYFPNRNFCNTFLTRMGVTTTYFDPLDLEALAGLFKDNTRVVFLESPGSLTFEMTDIPAIAALAHERGAAVLMDNTWATPLFFKPLDHGVDISVMAGTKYLVGHSDAMFGTVSANERTAAQIHEVNGVLGNSVGPDDIYLALRGARTLGVRLRQHMRSGLEIARWLESRQEVARVYHPGLESHAGHGLWKRDFTGASGLFSFEMATEREDAVHAFLDSLKLFGLGYSWGGFESLAIWARWQASRTASRPDIKGPLIRLHVGLEDIDDLKADLEQALDRCRPEL